MRGDQSKPGYTHPGGNAPLRAEIARYLAASRGVSCIPEQVIIATSTRAAILSDVSLLLRDSMAIAVEDPAIWSQSGFCRQPARKCTPFGLRSATFPPHGNPRQESVMIEFVLVACLGGKPDQCRTEALLLSDVTLIQCMTSRQFLASDWGGSATRNGRCAISRYQCRVFDRSRTEL